MNPRGSGRRWHSGTALSRALRDHPEPAYIVGAKARLSQNQISAYANGRKPIPKLHLLRLAEVLGRDPKDLLGP
jgi:hypothetical protein